VSIDDQPPQSKAWDILAQTPHKLKQLCGVQARENRLPDQKELGDGVGWDAFLFMALEVVIFLGSKLNKALFSYVKISLD
jgi:hypothetical protein